MEKSIVDISIILVNFRNVKLTENCIYSLMAAKTKVSYEIIVIDNHSEDGSVETLKKRFPQLTVVDSGRNGGFAFGNNAGVKLAEGKYLLLLNNDTEVKDGMLDALYQFAEKNPEVGILGCQALDRNGMELPIVHKYENLKRIWLQSYVKPFLEKIGLQRKLVKLAEHKDDGGEEFTSAEWIAGSAMFIKRELYYKIGGLDENYFMYMEDEDLCRRINNAGYKVGMIPFIGYVHYCGGSTIQSYFLTKEYIKSRLIFFMRYEPHNFAAIKKQLYQQIAVVNKKINFSERKQMKKELDGFVRDELSQIAQQVAGIKG